ncbi:MAG: ParB/RepB/Spo0J family partition protein [Ruminococcaceae bacterium]|nr:ParB/RepB/Spo0J family partition protein [Oscillospiraceae bacterium]
MAKKSGGLGRDFYSLLDDNMPENKKNGVSTLRIADIEPRSDQPRKIFEREALEALAESIGTYGVLQPIIVRENVVLAGSYEIIAGERRWRAAKMAGLSEIPVVILDSDDLKAAQVSIIENIQRENLNPVEEALAYRTLMDKFDLTQEQVATQVGKSRSNVANMMRLLDLPESVLDMLREGLLSTGHARALLGLEREEDMSLLAERIVQSEMTVREVERAVKAMNDAANAEPADADALAETAESKLRRVYIRDLEHRILEKMGRKAKITNSPKKKVIELAYDSDEDLEELLKALCGDDFFTEE